MDSENMEIDDTGAQSPCGSFTENIQFTSSTEMPDSAAALTRKVDPDVHQVSALIQTEKLSGSSSTIQNVGNSARSESSDGSKYSESSTENTSERAQENLTSEANMDLVCSSVESSGDDRTSADAKKNLDIQFALKTSSTAKPGHPQQALPSEFRMTSTVNRSPCSGSEDSEKVESQSVYPISTLSFPELHDTSKLCNVTSTVSAENSQHETVNPSKLQADSDEFELLGMEFLSKPVDKARFSEIVQPLSVEIPPPPSPPANDFPSQGTYDSNVDWLQQNPMSQPNLYLLPVVYPQQELAQPQNPHGYLQPQVLHGYSYIPPEDIDWPIQPENPQGNDPAQTPQENVQPQDSVYLVIQQQDLNWSVQAQALDIYIETQTPQGSNQPEGNNSYIQLPNPPVYFQPGNPLGYNHPENPQGNNPAGNH